MVEQDEERPHNPQTNMSQPTCALGGVINSARPTTVLTGPVHKT